MKSNEAIRLLVPQGKDPPPPLGGLALLGEASYKARRRSDHLLMSSVSVMMLCCCKLLTSSYPVQVVLFTIMRSFQQKNEIQIFSIYMMSLEM